MALSSQTRVVHFVGIGGIGMSGLAEILMELGHQVSGSDLKNSEMVERLRTLGAKIQIGHSEDIFSDFRPDVVVYSTAVSKDNPEIAYANRLHIPIIRRAEMLAELMRLKRGVAVAGSHGKTTTTAMLGLILKNSGIDPTLVIGGRFDAIGSNAAWGRGDWLVAEADESDGSFLKLMPEFCVVTNMDAEHLDHYVTFDNVTKAFSEFLDHIPFYGKAVLCSDSVELRKLSRTFNKPRLWYGFSRDQEPDFLLDANFESDLPVVKIFSRSSNFKEMILDFSLSIPGRHNLLNAAGAAILARELGVDNSVIQKSLKEFKGVRRRFELKGEVAGVKIYEDYAHHPTEILATLSAARSVFKNSKIVVLFQPHRFSRTKQCWEEFKTSFKEADLFYSTDIYPASEPAEKWTEEYNSETFFYHINKNGGEYCPSLEAAKLKLIDLIDSKKIGEGDAIFVLGAGDVNSVASKLVDE